MKLKFILLFTCIALFSVLTACDEGYLIFNIQSVTIEPAEEIQLEYYTNLNEENIVFSSSLGCVTVSQTGVIKGIYLGTSVITAEFGSTFDTVEVTVAEKVEETGDSVVLSAESYSLSIGETSLMNYTVNFDDSNLDASYFIETGNDVISILGNDITALDNGIAVIYVCVGDIKSNTITIVVEEILTSDPYIDMSEEEFYKNYQSATSALDAYYRSIHYFMSGDISDQDQEPTVTSNQPTEDGLLIKNSYNLFSEDELTYYVIDEDGDIVNQIYKNGAYVTLEEVAAYIYAYCDVPVNYTDSKYTDPEDSDWREYLRLNNNYFSGDTSKYPYEPELPNISGIGGNLQYYEVDVGTTGTDCDPSYTSELYNDGYSITRGAARIVYSRYYTDGSDIDDFEDRYVFYTYNHYNDFQEYLNYYNGWGEMFGNITGGGTISSYSKYNPSDYVEVVLEDLYGINMVSKVSILNIVIPPNYDDKQYFVN